MPDLQLIVGEMKRWVAALRVVGIGWYIGLCIAGGAGIGLLLDQTVHKGQGLLFTFIGLGVGLLLAFFGIYRLLRPFWKQEQDKEERDK